MCELLDFSFNKPVNTTITFTGLRERGRIHRDGYGTLRQYKKYLRLGTFLPLGTTDSEYAFCSKQMKLKLNDKLKWNSKIDTYLFNKSIPMFFSGMLSGQRALDIGSYERLIWHIKFAVIYMEMING